MMSFDQPTSIQFLSQDVKNQLRSGVATPSVVQCVEELVVNSIDAGASCIAVRVDLPDCKVQVVDNGKGITKDDMSYVGERYATSKCHDTKDLENISHYGYRGEALASIREIASVLEISSRARGSEVTYSKLYRHGKDQGILKDSKTRPSGGTTVTAHNVFYNLPVRRKMLCSPLVYEQICKRLQAISLIHPHISLTLRNDSTGVKSIQTHSSSSVVQTFGYLYGKDVADCLKEVNHIHTLFNVTGFIGTTSHRNKSLQFVYVNGRFVLKTKLHKLVNELLGNSLITKNKGKNQDAMQGYSVKSNPTTCQASPGGNQMEYGIFVLNITCPRSEYDITLDPSKTLVEFRDWEGVLTCVHELVTCFLQQEHLTMKLTPTLIGSEAVLQEADSFSKDNLESKETAVCGNAISTSDCKNAVQSTCVRRQTTGIHEPDVSLVEHNQNPCDVETAVVNNGGGDAACSNTSLNNPNKSQDVYGDSVENKNVAEMTQLDLTETPIPQSKLTIHAEKEKNLPSNNDDPLLDVGENCQPCGEIFKTSPVEKTPDNKQANVGPLKMQSGITNVLSSDVEENKTNKEAVLLLLSSELDVGSSEETLSSSEVEIGTPKSDDHQCCDARCMSLRKEDTDSGREIIDLVSPRTRIAKKARNSLSMFRRSVKKKKLAKSVKDDPSKKSGQKVNKHLQFVTASENKTIALRWHRSPGFRSRLESLNVKCQERPENLENPVIGVLHHQLSSCSEPNLANDDTSACNTPNDDSQKEVCQNFQQASINEISNLALHQKDLYRTEMLATTGAEQHVDGKHNCTVSMIEQESKPVEDKEPPVKHLEGHIATDASRDKCTEVTTDECCVRGRERMDGNVRNIARNLISESTDTKKRAADHPNCPISHKEQKKVVPFSRNIDSSASSASSEMPREFLTSTSFMVSVCEVFSNREPPQASDHTSGCTEINSTELDQKSNQCTREANEVMPHQNQKRPVAVLLSKETEPFSVHIEDEIADDAGDVNEDETFCDGTSCSLMAGDALGIEASGIQHTNEMDPLVNDEQSAMISLKSDLNNKETVDCDVEQMYVPDTIQENLDLLDVSDADDSISLLYVPQQNEESLCNKTKSCPELISSEVQSSEERDASTNIQFTESAMVASSTSSIAHQNNDELDVTIDLPFAPEVSSAIQDKPVNTLYVGSEEVKPSSKDDRTAESERACESFFTTHSENMDSKNSSAGRTDAEFAIESSEWYSVYDASRGMKVFINRFNGNCTLEKPGEGPTVNQEPGQISGDPQFSMVTKSDTLAHSHLSHSAAPFVTSLRDRRESSSHTNDPPMTPGTMATIDAAMEDSQGEDDELAIVKWGNSRRIPATDEAPLFSKYDQGFLTSTMSEGSSSIDAKFQAKVLASLNPCQFTKGMFNSIKILGQVDSKFIACLVNSDYDTNPAGEPHLLVLVDQHAAHERIRLEMLTQDACTTSDVDDETRSIRSSDITPALPVSLSQSEMRLMEAYSHKLKRIGIEYTLSEDTVMVTQLPACVVEKEASELKRGRQTIATTVAETLIKEVLDSLEHQSGAVSSLPMTITRILNSQACHGAIKFGDTLDLNECKTLIGQLSSCDLPFQCAHGRPALMPILDFRKIKLGNSEKVTPSQPQVWKLKYLSPGTIVK